LTGALHDLQLQLSVTTTSVILLAPVKPANQGSPGKMAVKMETERKQLYAVSDLNAMLTITDVVAHT